MNYLITGGVGFVGSYVVRLLLKQGHQFTAIIRRKENKEELNSLIEEWSLNYSAEEVMAILQKNNVSAGIIEDAADLIKDPQLINRKLFQRLNHDEMGEVLHRGAPFQLSKTPWALIMPGPCLGQHTENICREFLGISDEEFIQLLNIGAFE